MNIAIYNGNLQPTTFVLRLAQVVNEEHTVLVSGSSPKLFKHQKQGLNYLPTDPSNKLVLLIQFVLRLLVFFCVQPKKCRHFVSLLRNSDKPLLTRFKQFLIWSKFISNNIEVVHIQWASHIFLFEEILEHSYFKTMVSLRGRLINITPLAEADLKALYQRTFPKVNQFHAVTHHIKKQAMIYGAAEDKIKVIYSGVEVNSFDAFRKKDYAKRDTLQILSVGRQHWKKGYNYALEALKIVLERDIKATFTIIGAADSEEIIYTVHDLNLKNEVRLTSKMDYQDVLKEMQKADVLVLPSVSEGLANVVIEAMALGLPVISTNAVGMSELVIHKETGLLFENRDVNDLAEMIKGFNSMPQEDVKKMTDTALKKVIIQHNWKTFKQSFNDFYTC
ncbi:glycosyltransferase family 4 protein [Psychroserpens ponticola]|uniref:Glycosyltransferase family 4 protein n=1 Tax=Psychroserpens ponticola TaxID=2932268 RepID=A0ABY7S075_9FLAO|nr:glycosyltransferase family 4 protein [Psychroserpens ponticola]WCO02533.1 glycosyltransferase family 4 protein [Psychroserpens ponticola]